MFKYSFPQILYLKAFLQAAVSFEILNNSLKYYTVSGKPCIWRLSFLPASVPYKILNNSMKYSFRQTDFFYNNELYCEKARMHRHFFSSQDSPTWQPTPPKCHLNQISQFPFPWIYFYPMHISCFPSLKQPSALPFPLTPIVIQDKVQMHSFVCGCTKFSKSDLLTVKL